MAVGVHADTVVIQATGVTDSTAAADLGTVPEQHANQQSPATAVVPASNAPTDGAPAANPIKEASLAGSSSSEDSGKPCYLHVSSFRTAEHAESVAGDYGQRNLPAIVRSQDVSGVLWYRVYLGPFSGHEAAVHRANELRDDGTITYYKVTNLEPDAGS
ncbi:MAG: SPOR domain-containing protein [bacterium]|nr:SPOR domain-containing protein [bacterium]